MEKTTGEAFPGFGLCSGQLQWYSHVPVGTEKQSGHDLGGRFSKGGGIKKKVRSSI